MAVMRIRAGSRSARGRAMPRSLRALGTLGLLCAAASVWSQNVVFRCKDETGRMQYTNVRSDVAGRQCEVVQGEVSVVPANSPAVPGTAAPRPAPAAPQNTTTASNRVDRDTQKGRDNSRRRILQDELAQEEQLLGKARADLTAQESVRGGDERNYQRVLDRLKPYQETVERHARNVEALRKELGVAQ